MEPSDGPPAYISSGTAMQIPTAAQDFGVFPEVNVSPQPPQAEVHEAVLSDRLQLKQHDSTSQDDAELVNLIKGYLQDPTFHEEVDRMAQLWDKAQEELLAEQGLQISMDVGD